MASFTIDARNRLHEILQRIGSKNVLVVGDLILDHYIETATRKLAREAPIPVSKVIKERSFAGGAANLAVNITSLGSKVHIAGVVGRDYEGEELDSILRKEGIDTNAILKIDRDTTLQTRYYLDNHLHLRIDREVTDDLPKYIADKLFENIKDIIDSNKIDCICISDYDKGTITPRLLKHINILAKEMNIPVYGQPMVKHYLDFIGFTAIKSNIKEASKATGISILNESSMHNLGINLLTRLSCKYLILTRGKKGLIAFEDNSIISIPSLVEKEYRRSVGIRDAMTAILALALSSEADLLEAALLCNIAAAISTQGPYTLILSKKTYHDYIDRFEAQLITKVPLHR
ncbi:MAG: RfaE bifunctional protein, domain I [Candidatus Nitrosocaldaceae archaeon]|nr:MAG: RfaE bifunctional protein, domain I [Candidatus Nitrosocaldaceae archaeon]